jgi:hypothetical protein
MKYVSLYSFAIIFLFSCKKDNKPVQIPVGFNVDNVILNGTFKGITKVPHTTPCCGTGTYKAYTYVSTDLNPSILISFSTPINKNSVTNGISFNDIKGGAVSYSVSYENNDSVMVIQPNAPLSGITEYEITVGPNLQSTYKNSLQIPVIVFLTTAIDSTDKFPRISDSALLTLVEQQTFKYFWDFGHPVSGMARERNTSGDVCATGGTGFGIMSIVAGIYRNFISRTEGLDRIQEIVSFLQNKCTRYHGAFSHWINGATGATIPFSAQDNGADLVETSYLMMGLLCARQYFNQHNAAEDSLRNDINQLWNNVEWTWFISPPSGGSEGPGLFWHWSPDYGWENNQIISGWNEALITYILAASANQDSISKAIYDNGWARNGAMKNGKQFYGITLPLGPDYGGPLFFSQYSFLGLDPHGLSDAYAYYWIQDTAQTKINYLYCVNNPQNYYGYSPLCWGLTASDDNNGYAAHSPTNDDGVISPTAAISSLPYAPQQSMDALKFFYYTLGDKIWGQYGFTDAFNLTDVWFANSYLAIDQGPEIVMIENYRSGLLWNLFMSCPEVQRGLGRLGFTYKK